MNVRNRVNRMFGACILLMMAVLAVGTIAFAAATEGEAGSSYSLTIKKAFDFSENDGIPDEVKEKAREQKYTFRIDGTYRKKETVDGVEQWVDAGLSKEITLPVEGKTGEEAWELEVYRGDGPFNVTVTELTDNIDIEDSQGKHYNMSNSSSDTNVLIDSRKHEVQLKNNSILNITRPRTNNVNAPALWYRISNRPYGGHPTSNFQAVDETFCLNAGDRKTMRRLCAAIYTIEQIAAPDGYQLQMGTRKEAVGSGGAGHFYINGTPGKLTLTAGGTRGDGATHYYTVDRTEQEEGDTSGFVMRTVPIASGESYVLENLPRGRYTVKEYTIEAGEAYKVTAPETVTATGSGKSSGLSKTADSRWISMSLTYPKGFDVDYIRMNSFGPLYNLNGNRLNSSTSYAVFRYGVAYGTKVTDIHNHTSGFTGDKTFSIKDPPKLMVDSSAKLAFTATGVVSNTAKTIGVSWTAYDEKETEKTIQHAGTVESVTVDDRRWIRIEAPVLNDPNAAGADQVAYYYTLKDENGSLVQGTTDRSGTTVKLKPGEQTELALPAAGSYTIVENIVGSTSVGFSMMIDGYPFGTTEAGTPIDIKVGGRRTVTVSKPALGSHPEGSADNREYVFSVSGSDFSETVRMKAGESRTVTLPRDGSYTITPQNDTPGTYELNYKDSGAIYGTASGTTGTITFTNSFSAGECGYRFVHEYYVREPDGTYTYEGKSQISTRLGRESGESFQGLDIGQAPDFNENHYEHFDDAYGWVDPIEPAVSVQADQEEESLADAAAEAAGSADVERAEFPAGGNADSGAAAEPESPDGAAAGSGGAGESESSSTGTGGSGGAGESESSSTGTGGSGGAGESESSSAGTAGSEEGKGSEPSAAGAAGSEEGGESELSSADTAGSEGGGESESSSAGTAGSEGGGESESSSAGTAGSEGGGESELSSAESGGSGEGGESELSAAESAGSEGGGGPEPLAADAAGSADAGKREADGVEPFGETGADPPDSEAQAAALGETMKPESPAEDSADSGEEDKTGSSGEAAAGSEAAGSEGQPAGDAEGTAVAGAEGQPAGDAEGTAAAGAEGQPAGDAEGTAAAGSEGQPAGDAEGTAAAGAEGQPAEETKGTADTGSEGLSVKAAAGLTDPADSQIREDEVSGGGNMTARADGSETYDGEGIVDKGIGKDSRQGDLNYGPRAEMDHVDVTEGADQIIIKRYLRERQPEGMYNVIHVYYRRDENGDHWEGASGVLPQKGELGIRYTGDKVEKVYYFQPADAEWLYAYTWDGRPQYGVVEETGDTGSYRPDGGEFSGDGRVYRPNNAWTAAEGTVEGNQLIILRYYREMNKEGCYHIVHEYYARENGGSQADALEDAGSEEGIRPLSADFRSEYAGSSEDAGSEGGIRLLNADFGDEYAGASEDSEAEEDVSDTFIGTLDRNRGDGYVYTFEGNTEPESVTALLGSVHTAKRDDWRLTYEGNTYTYIDAGYGTKSGDERYSFNPHQQWAASTEQGDDIIILRYVREALSEDPEIPPEVPDSPGDPQTPPETVDGSRDSGAFARQSGRGGSDSTGEIRTLQNGVPGTGDNSRTALWMTLTAVSLCGLAILVSSLRKRREE